MLFTIWTRQSITADDFLKKRRLDETLRTNEKFTPVEGSVHFYFHYFYTKLELRVTEY